MTSPDRLRFSWGDHDGTLTAYVDRDSIGDVVWYGTRAVEVAVERAVTTGRVATVSGPYGAGKTFSVARACEAYVSDIDPHADVSYLRGASLGRERRLYAEIFDQLTGFTPSNSWSAGRIRQEIQRHVNERSGIIVVDEAQRLGRKAQEAIQEVVDFAPKGTGVVLVGDDSLEQTLIGELKRRRPTDCRIELKPIADEEIHEVLAQLHPVLDRTDVAVLRELNRHTRGLFSRWAEVVGNTEHLGLDTADGIDQGDIDVLVGAL